MLIFVGRARTLSYVLSAYICWTRARCIVCVECLYLGGGLGAFGLLEVALIDRFVRVVRVVHVARVVSSCWVVFIWVVFVWLVIV